jgi:hypothetical protein
VLMATELPRRPYRRFVSNIFYSLKNPDFVAVCVFAIIGLLLTIFMAQIFPLDKAIDLLLLPDWNAAIEPPARRLRTPNSRVLPSVIGGPGSWTAFVMLADQQPLTAPSWEGHRRPLGGTAGIQISMQRAPAAHRPAIFQGLRLADAHMFGRGASQILHQANGCLRH